MAAGTIEERHMPDVSIVWETPSTPITPEDFIHHDGVRFVRPYFFEFIAHVKERWDKKTVTNLFAEEFRQRPLDYYCEAVNAGRILVNGKRVRSDYVVRASQTLSHFVHRHEPPVMGEPVRILELSADVVTIWKPPSVPVHPCGQYRKNTVLGILEAEHSLKPLYPIHRLDRLVSGLLILARNADTADQFRKEMEGGKVTKSYIAKVKGVFPDEEMELSASIVYDAREGRSTVERSENSATGNSHQHTKLLGKGKSACTKFKRLSTDGMYSIVECTPLTGRTHQIRVHLQYLGHPIANDDLYCSDNPAKRTGTGTSAERAARLERILQKGASLDDAYPKRRRMDDVRICALDDVGVSLYENIEDEGLDASHGTVSDIVTDGHGAKFVLDSMCTNCPNLCPSGYEGKEDGLWLHCRSYSGSNWKYECPLPSWARLSLSTPD